ncbi:MAG: choice-of-anchor D domain-containing protein, partial [Acidobacteriaceae bacterium]
VYMTSDGGTPQSGWQLIGTGLPNVAVLELKIVPAGQRLLLAATHGRGAWTIPLDGSAPLGAPTLQAPINGSTTTPNNTAFIWSGVAGANGYRILVSSNPAGLPTDPASNSCPGCIISDTSPVASYSSLVGLAVNTTYTWQVQAYNSGNGQNGPWSARATFIAGYQPDNLTFTPNILNFGNNGVFSTVSQNIQITNGGIGPAMLSSISIQDTRQFSVSNLCPVLLNPSATCPLTVTFSPQSIGIQQTQLTITNASNGTSHTLLVLGTGLNALISLDFTAFDFGAQLIGSDSQPRTLNIRNPGNMVLVFGMFYSGDFRGTTTCGSQLAAGASCSTSIVFHPTASGTRSGNIMIYDNTQQGSHVIQLTGTGSSSCGKQSGGVNVGCIHPTPTQ